MMGAGGFGQQMDASMLNGFTAAAQAALMQQQPPMQNNFGCGFSPLPDPSAMNTGFSTLPDPNATNTGMQAMGEVFGQMPAAQPATFDMMQAQPLVDPSSQFPSSQPQVPPPS